MPQRPGSFQFRQASIVYPPPLPPPSPLSSSLPLISAELSHSLNSFGSSTKHAEIGPESFGIVVCRFVGTVLDILGLVWPSFRPKSGSESTISGRILNKFSDRKDFWPRGRLDSQNGRFLVGPKTL